MRFVIGLVGLLVVLLVVFAVVSPGVVRSQQPPPDVVIQDFQFSPAAVRGTVASGGGASMAKNSFTWVNRGPSSHTVTADGGAFDSGPLAKDATFSFTFRTEGVFSYRCRIHPTMRGEIVVEKVDPDKPDEPGGYGY
jgi:plastocyanin